MYFAIQVSTGKEDSLIKLINERIDHSFFAEVFAPKRLVGRKINGEWTDKLINVFPGYIFVDTTEPKEFSGALYRMPQFAKLLGREESSGSFVPLQENECIMIDSLCGKDVSRLLNKSIVSLRVGKTIEIISGPLVGFKGNISKIDLHKRIAIVNLKILNRITQVYMPIEILREN